LKSRIDLKHFASGGVLRLGSRLALGEYVLQVMVTDKAAKKASAAAQWINFDVTPPTLSVSQSEVAPERP
jgi:hypothetical protein